MECCSVCKLLLRIRIRPTVHKREPIQFVFQDGTKEEGKYKNNVLITSQKKKHLFLIRSAKFRERIEAAVSAAQRASKIALQKADIAISRTSTARGKAELADVAAVHAREDADFARIIAKQLAPDFQPSKYLCGPSLLRLVIHAESYFR